MQATLVAIIIRGPLLPAGVPLWFAALIALGPAGLGNRLGAFVALGCVLAAVRFRCGTEVIRLDPCTRFSQQRVEARAGAAGYGDPELHGLNLRRIE